MATMRENPSLDPETEAKKLYHAMKGRGCDESEIIKILTSCTEKQREMIKYKYKSVYGEDLMEMLKKELKSTIEMGIVALMTPRLVFIAQELYDAFKGVGAEEETLIDLLIPASKSELRAVIDLYKSLYKRDLIEDISKELSGKAGLRSVLLAHLTFDRDEGSDDNKVAQRAGQLKRALSESKWDEESDFAYIFNKSSFQDIRHITEEFEGRTGIPLEAAIRERCKGLKYQAALIAIVRVSRSVAGYFADRLSDAMAGRGCDERAIMRILRLRAEEDMLDIKNEYRKRFGRSLEEALQSETKSHFRNLVTSMIMN